MVRQRPNVRLVALLVCALVVNALAWVNGAIAKPMGPASVICHTTGAVAPSQPLQPAAHVCCDIACSALSVLLPPAGVPAPHLPPRADVPCENAASSHQPSATGSPNARGPPPV
jgi:hypothetical protein